MSFAKLMQRFKDGYCEPGPAGRDRNTHHDPVRLATASILLDIAYADGTFTPGEGEDLLGYLQRAFALAPDEAQELIKAAAEIRSRTIDHFELTNFIRKSASLEERIEIVRTMWRMVYSDGRLTDYENYLVRKLADLLGLEHHVMISTKVAVLQELGATQ